MLITILSCLKLGSVYASIRRPEWLYLVATTEGGDVLGTPIHSTWLALKEFSLSASLLARHPPFWAETLQWLVCVGGIYTFLIWPE